MTFSFDSGVAEKVGIPGAVVFNCFCFWLSLNESEGRNQHEGKTWTFNSVSGLAETFTFLSKDQIRRAIDRLVEGGFLEVGRFNRLGFDRTRWFTIGPAGKAFVPNPIGKNAKRDRRSCQSEVATMPDQYGNGAAPIPVMTTGVDPIVTTDREGADAPPAPARTSKAKGKGPVRHKYGCYKRVLLSDADLETLKTEFHGDWQERISRLDEYIEQTGKIYRNHLATIRAWARRDDTERKVVSFGKSHFDSQPGPVPKIKSAIDDLFV